MLKLKDKTGKTVGVLEDSATAPEMVSIQSDHRCICGCIDHESIVAEGKCFCEICNKENQKEEQK